MTSATNERWSITSMKKREMNSAKIQQMVCNELISLENVIAYDIEIETTTGNKRDSRKTMLYGIPM
jgi:hypothetical protein